MGIAVTLHDLGGVRVHGQAQTGQGLFPPVRGKGRRRCPRAGDLAHAHALDTGLDALQMALEFGVEAGHLEAEAGGFGMDAVGAAHAEHALVLAGQGFQRSQHLLDVFHDELAGLHEQIAVGGVHDGRKTYSQMDVAGVGAHLFFQRSEEGDDVVTGGLLDLEDASTSMSAFSRMVFTASAGTRPSSAQPRTRPLPQPARRGNGSPGSRCGPWRAGL